MVVIGSPAERVSPSNESEPDCGSETRLTSTGSPYSSTTTRSTVVVAEDTCLAYTDPVEGASRLGTLEERQNEPGHSESSGAEESVDVHCTSSEQDP